MSNGRILQIGAPRDIYEHPSDRFVANFIGETNFLEGEIERASDSRAEIRLESGVRLTATLPGNRPASGRATVVVRPEHAAVQAAAGTGMSGTLENIVYSGVDTQFHVRLPSGELFLVRAQNQRGAVSSFALGKPVGISIQEGAAQVLRD
jgi:spermidine/putrescine transport system ATP-binding protein